MLTFFSQTPLTYPGICAIIETIKGAAPFKRQKGTSMKIKTKFFLTDEDILDVFGGVQPEVGTDVLLLHVVDENRPSTDFWRIRPTAHQPAAQTDGMPGNQDSAITRFHGWRGTTNGRSVTAHGVRTIVSVDPARRTSDFDRTVCVVTVGDDLHPDWN